MNIQLISSRFSRRVKQKQPIWRLTQLWRLPDTGWRAGENSDSQRSGKQMGGSVVLLIALRMWLHLLKWEISYHWISFPPSLKNSHLHHNTRLYFSQEKFYFALCSLWHAYAPGVNVKYMPLLAYETNHGIDSTEMGGLLLHQDLPGCSCFVQSFSRPPPSLWLIPIPLLFITGPL